ncbi:TPA: hypothetical protein R3948_000040 [Salmonella enterica subsp. enterica serovar Kottbus]|nr:hypothetical protein [Salmonella enterica subsp. enterica serovar Kottbus]
MIENYNNDYDYDDNEYLNDDTIEIPLSCEDDEYIDDYLREQEQEKKSVLQKMVEYKNENSFFYSFIRNGRRFWFYYCFIVRVYFYAADFVYSWIDCVFYYDKRKERF